MKGKIKTRCIALIAILCILTMLIPNYNSLHVEAASFVKIAGVTVSSGKYYLTTNGTITETGASADNYNIWVKTNSEFYFNNATIYYGTYGNNAYGIYSEGYAINLNLKGSNYIKAASGTAYSGDVYGIYTNKVITVKSESTASPGSLRIITPTSGNNFTGMRCGGSTDTSSVTITNNASVYLNNSNGGFSSCTAVDSNSGTRIFNMSGNSYFSVSSTFNTSSIANTNYFIYAKNVNITENSKLIIHENGVDYSSRNNVSKHAGIYCNGAMTITDSVVDVKISGDCLSNDVTSGTKNSFVYGIFTNGNLTVTDSDKDDDFDTEISSVLDSNNGISGKQNECAAALRTVSMNVSGNVAVDSIFRVLSGTTDNYIYGTLTKGNMELSDGVVYNASATGGRYSYGTHVLGGITVADSSYTSVGGNSSAYAALQNTHSVGTFLSGTVTVNDSTFTSKGLDDFSKNGGQSIGLYASNDGNVALINNGGEVLLTADQAETGRTDAMSGIVISAGTRGGIKNNYGRVVTAGYTYGIYSTNSAPVTNMTGTFILYADKSYKTSQSQTSTNITTSELNEAILTEIMDLNSLTVNKIRDYYKYEYIEAKTKVTFNANGGSCSTKSVFVGMDDKYCVKTLPTATVPAGSTFIGWYPNSDGTGDKLTTSTRITKDTTYYAQYSEIPRTSITGATVTPAKSSYTYTGSAITPTVTVVLNGTTLKKDEDYTVAYSNNKNVGTATVTVTGVGLYKDTATGTFAINKANPTVTLQNQTITQGEEIDLTNVLSIKFNNTEQNIGKTWYFYSDSAGNNHIGQPSAPGTYYYKAVTEETADFKPTESNIAKLVINKKNINVTIATYDHSSTYDGAEHTISVKCYADSVEVQGATVYYGTSNDKSKMSTTPIKYTDAGTYTVYAYCSYDGFESNVSQAEVKIFKATPELTVNDQRVSYSAAEPNYTSTVQYNGVVLSDIVVNYALYRDLDCTQPVQYSDINSSPGNYIIKGTTVETNNYKSTTAIANLTVAPAGVISLNINSVDAVYDGTEKTVTYTVSLNGQDVTSASTVTFTINGSTTQNAPKGTNVNDSVEFTAVASYNGVDSGIENGHISITKATPTLVCADVKLVYDAPEPDILYSVTFNGETVQTGKTVKYYSDAEGVHEVQYNAIKTVPGTYYYRLTTDATDNFLPVSAVKSLTIGAAPAPEKIDISTLKAYINGSFVYKGSAYKPVMVITDANGVALVAGTDYTLSYSNNINAGKATVTAKAKGDKYKGTKKATFTISARPVTDKNVKISAIPDQKYTGKAITPNPVIKFNGKTLKKGTDYTLSYSNNKKVGTASVKITGKGNFKSSKTIKFRIVKSTNVKTVTMYRIYNPNSGEHFYTSNTTEVANLVAAGWANEGLAWKAPEKSSIPVYRLYNENAGDHHYTMSTAERDSLVSAGWKYEGIGWYSDENKGVALYRLYNPNAVAGSHHYTTSAAERDNLIKAGWQSEGLAWYGVK